MEPFCKYKTKRWRKHKGEVYSEYAPLVLKRHKKQSNTNGDYCLSAYKNWLRGLLLTEICQIGVPTRGSSSRWLSKLWYLSWLVDESNKRWIEVVPRVAWPRGKYWVKSNLKISHFWVVLPVLADFQCCHKQLTCKFKLILTDKSKSHLSQLYQNILR